MLQSHSSVRTILLVLGSIVYLLAGAEAVSRLLGGYQFSSLQLIARPEPKAPDNPRYDAFARAMLAEATFSSEVDPEWFFLKPAPMVKPTIPELTERTEANPEQASVVNYLWNDAILNDPDKATVRELKRLNVDDIFSFHSYDGGRFPWFRLYPDVTAASGATNRFGWFADDVTLAKPARTIRVGILGDSTSHSDYGRYLQIYLTSWVRKEGLNLKIEVLNAGRQGLSYDDVIPVLRYELGPMGLDYVYLYMASRVAFNFVQFVKLPDGVHFGEPPAANSKSLTQAVHLLGPLAKYSALDRNLIDHLTLTSPDSSLVEPQKPHTEIILPPDLNEQAPDTRTASEIPYYQYFLGKLDRFAQTAKEMDVTPVASTERLCMYDKMVVRHVPNQHLFDSANGASVWPVTYGQAARLATLNNKIIRRWAGENAVAFIDIARYFPRHPEICWDIFHDMTLAEHLRAWIMMAVLDSTDQA